MNFAELSKKKLEIHDGKRVQVMDIIANLASVPVNPANFHEGLEELLEFLCSAFGADDAEVFLSEHKTDEVLMCACVGPDKDELLTKTSFKSDSGFPGTAYARRRLVVTRNLGQNRRFLRKAVTDKGIHSFVSAPIPGFDGKPLGCFDLAWKRSDIDTDNLSMAISMLVQPLSKVIASAYWAVRENSLLSLKNLEKWGAPNQANQAAGFILEFLIKTGSADFGSLVLWDPRTKNILSHAEKGLVTCNAAISDNTIHQSKPSITLIEKPDGEAVCHVPIGDGVSIGGMALLGYRKRDPDSHSYHSYMMRSFVPLRIAAQEVSAKLPAGLFSTGGTMAVGRQITSRSVEIKCFGGFELRIDGRVVAPQEFNRRQSITLLKILVLNAGRPIHRDRLIDWLWDDEEPEDIRLNRLHGVVHSLRNVIEADPKKRLWRYVLNNGENYMFDPKAPGVSIDVSRFRELMEHAARTGRSDGDARKIIDRLEEAVRIYTGSLFEDEPYAEWCNNDRFEFEKDYIDALVRLSKLYAGLGDNANSIRCLRRALKQDPLREDLHDELAVALTRSGRTHEASAQRQQCLRIMREELGSIDYVSNTGHG
ncbi:MAG: BTAD domain-containing putative transcriptional regulator [Bdellovibrionota bacterium]